MYTNNQEALATLDVLRSGRSSISRPGGWTKLSYGNPDDIGPHCAIGGVTAGGSIQAVATHRAEEELRKQHEMDGHNGSVEGWNDSRARKKAVLRLFDRTIARLEACMPGEQRHITVHTAPPEKVERHITVEPPLPERAPAPERPAEPVKVPA